MIDSSRHLKNRFSRLQQQAVERDFIGFSGLLSAELQRRRQSPNNQFPRKIGQLSEAQRHDIVDTVFLDWVHHQLHFSKFSRDVLISNTIRNRVWRPQFDEIVKQLRFGVSLKPRQGRKLAMERARLVNFRHDMFFSKFKIAHYHLNSFVPLHGMVAGTQDLLYVYLDGDVAVVLDVGPHDFSLRNAIRLFGVMAQELPEIAEMTQLKKAVGLASEPSEKMLSCAVPKHYNSAFRFGDKFYLPPSIGTMANGHIMNARRRLDEIEEEWEKNYSEIENVRIEIYRNSYLLVSGQKGLVQTGFII